MSDLGPFVDDMTRPVTGSLDLRFGVVTARSDPTVTDSGTATVKGIETPYLSKASPNVNERVAYLEQGPRRVILGTYGHDNPRYRAYLNSNAALAPNSVLTPGDIWFDTTCVIETQQAITHSQVTSPANHTFQYDGFYKVNAGIEFAPGDGIRFLLLRLNGATLETNHDYSPSAIFNTAIKIGDVFEFSAGDVLTMAYVHTNSTGNINMIAGRGSTYLAIRRCDAKD